MSTQKAPKNAGLLTALDGLLSLAVLALAGYYIEYFYTVIEKGNASGKWGLVALMFLGMTLAQVIRIYLARSKHHLDVVRHTVYAAVFLVCAVLILLSRQSADSAVLTIEAYTQDIHFKLVAWLYEASLIFSRVLTILRDRTRRSTLINLALIAVIVILMWQMEMISMILFIAWQCVAHVGTIAFARIDMPTLKKIVRKTYAAEILFGIVLLIVAFSLVFPYLEEGIATFNDALWYCFAIVTTIGFGDFSAVTPLGRILSVILGIYGIIVVALITSIIVNFYGEMKSNDDED
ncbi:MAG: two pore domain potassium channel family protein [Clostridia bacterium]|nr:two pore domain potassium channel family protein [Clostridia bacterium]MBQ6121014.1 two pore domain potassium channel family protein [Clostridia bacterium]MBQ9038449.1 two pore domain potassium channel family protein [Clostridia bacterium]